MATRDGDAKDDHGSISRFFVRQNKKRSLSEIGQASNRSEPAKTRVTSSAAPESGQSAAFAISIDESSPSQDVSNENVAPLVVVETNDDVQAPCLPAIEHTADHVDQVPKTKVKGNEEAEGHVDSVEKKVETVLQQQDNPFAQFSFQNKSSSGASRLGNKADKVPWQTSTGSLRHGKSAPQSSIRMQGSSKSRPHSGSADNEKKTKSAGWVRMADLSSEEQEKVRRKWHSLADANASLEVRRFQVLVAARLHARCQDLTVRKVMQSLRDVFSAMSQDGLCVAAVANADPEVLANILSSLQYYNTKAKHIVKSAQEIQSRFGGKVPESEHSLRQLTGIGPVMADLLAFINTRAAHATTPMEKEAETSS